MAGSTNNVMTNPAVSASGNVDTLLIERFTGKVHEEYMKGENLLSFFEVQEVTGTNMVTNKYIGGTVVQKMTPGQEPEATTTQLDKASLVVDTMLLARNTVNTLHDIQSDVKVQAKIAKNQMGKLKEQEDEMVVQQLLATALTGSSLDDKGKSDGSGVRRLDDHGTAIKVEITEDQSQDPYALVAAMEAAVRNLIKQKVPRAGLKILTDLESFSVLQDMGFVAMRDGGSAEVSADSYDIGARGTLKSVGVPIIASVTYTEVLEKDISGDYHSLFSNADNGNRYDITAEMQKTKAVVFGKDALLCGRTIALQGDIFFDKKTKGYFIDSWFSEGATADRFDNAAVVVASASGTTSGCAKYIKGRALMKAKATRTVS